jgi:hypothetical protein
MQRFGFLGLLATLLIAGVAGVIGYNWGYSAGLASAAADGATVVYAPGFGWGGGFGFFGLIFGLILVFVIFGVVRRAIFGWGGSARSGAYGYGHGPWGYGRWSADARTGTQPGSDRAASVPPFVEGMLKDWHRQAHDQAGPTTDASTPPSGGPSPA